MRLLACVCVCLHVCVGACVYFSVDRSTFNAATPSSQLTWIIVGVSVAAVVVIIIIILVVMAANGMFNNSTNGQRRMLRGWSA